jgi:hypothetical protein
MMVLSILPELIMPYLPSPKANSDTLKTLPWKIALAVFLFWPIAAAAADKPRVEVWLINTRCAPVCGDWEQGKEQINYWRMDGSQQWIAETADSFAHSGEKTTPTIFLVHGNRTSNDESVQFAWPIYCWLSQQADERQYKVVIWSWPSIRTHKHQRADVQTKVCYCDSQSYYLADCLRDVNPETPVSLVGYSLGSRIIAGSLHLLGGGTLAGRCMPELKNSEDQPKRSAPIRAVLVAAALDCFALAPDQENGCATSQVEEMLVTRNVCDTALRWYPRLYGRGGPEALGFVGPCCGNAGNIHLFDATCCVGKSHEWEDYIYCPNLFGILPHYLFAEQKQASDSNSL